LAASELVSSDMKRPARRRFLCRVGVRSNAKGLGVSRRRDFRKVQ